MSQFHRSSAYAIFIPEVDAEHRMLIRTVSELDAAIASGARRARGEILQSLVSQLQNHFAHEERLMRASRYEALAWHKGQHDGARRQVKRFIKRIEEGDRKAGTEMLQYLVGWLEGHILVTDRMMAAYLRNFGRRRAA
jgi:hemerythrin-like metal-binding protein